MSTIDVRSPIFPVALTLNGKKVRLNARAGSRLLDVLREEAGFTGVKEGCGEGECGACTVLMDGNAICSCLTMAQTAEDTEVVTVEGLADRVDQKVHPVQKHFVKQMGTQCGFCTPGMVLVSAQLLEENPNASREAIMEAISSVLCRCTGYTRIVKAVEDARDELKSR